MIRVNRKMDCTLKFNPVDPAALSGGVVAASVREENAR
jgi:hypothetical protein